MTKGKGSQKWFAEEENKRLENLSHVSLCKGEKLLFDRSVPLSLVILTPQSGFKIPELNACETLNLLICEWPVPGSSRYSICDVRSIFASLETEVAVKLSISQRDKMRMLEHSWHQYRRYAIRRFFDLDWSKNRGAQECSKKIVEYIDIHS